MKNKTSRQFQLIYHFLILLRYEYVIIRQIIMWEWLKKKKRSNFVKCSPRWSLTVMVYVSLINQINGTSHLHVCLYIAWIHIYFIIIFNELWSIVFLQMLILSVHKILIQSIRYIAPRRRNKGIFTVSLFICLFVCLLGDSTFMPLRITGCREQYFMSGCVDYNRYTMYL